MNILITDISSYKAVAVAESLSSLRDVRIHTCDHRPQVRWLRSRYARRFHLVPAPSESPREYVAAIRDLQRSQQIDAIFPTNSREIRLLLAHRQDFGAALSSVGSLEMFRKLDNKRSLQALAETLGIAIPRSYSSLEAVRAYPVVLKVEESASAEGVFIALRRDHADQIMKERFGAARPVIQEYVTGEGCGLSVFAVNGQITAWCGHRRIAEFPVRGGSSTIRGPFFHSEMLSIAEKLVLETGWTGLAMFEFKHTIGGEIVLIECNPRIWGSIQQSIRSGVDFPKIVVNFLRDRSPAHPRAEPEREAYTFLSPLHGLSLLGYLRKGEWGPFREYGRHRWRMRPDISPWRDPLGYLSLVARAL